MKEYNEEIYVVDGNDVICVCEEYCGADACEIENGCGRDFGSRFGCDYDEREEEIVLGHGVSDEEYYREFCVEAWGDEETAGDELEVVPGDAAGMEDEDDDYEELGDGFGSDFEEPFSVIFEEYEEDGKDVSGQPRKIA